MKGKGLEGWRGEEGGFPGEDGVLDLGFGQKIDSSLKIIAEEGMTY